jgi:hypothetical protein
VKRLLLIISLAATLFLCVRVACGQTAIISPTPKWQLSDQNGKPYSGGLVFSYAAGTTTPQATFADSTGLILNPNPIVLDSAGRASVFLTCGISYKFVIQNSLSVAQYTQDNVTLPCVSVGGANTQVEFNCFSALCGSPNFTWTNGTSTLNIIGSLDVSAGGLLNGPFAGNPNFTGTPTSTTGSPGDASTQIATDAFVAASAAAGVTSFNGRHGAVVSQAGDYAVAQVTGAAPLASPAFTEVPTAPTAAPGTSTTQLATTAFVQATSKTVLSHNIVSMSSNVVLTANVASTILTQAVTMPTTGCPCRAIVNYQLGLAANVNGTAFNAWVTDGTSGWGSAQVYSDDGGRTPGIGASAISQNTYSNSANITFTLKVQDQQGSTVNAAFSSGAPQNSYMTVDIVTSN